MEEEKVRLYVGGLASEVNARDLQERFAPLGSVQSITFAPAKAGGHRGFAYVDFVPATDASLRKLFSAYNGCNWRGGILRIEKAKEHFTVRLQREWTAEAAVLTGTDVPAHPVEVVRQDLPGSGSQKGVKENKSKMAADGFNIFFPSLRKLKTVPVKGLGKHKRSFPNVECYPLHLLSTCACDEHSGPCCSYGRSVKVKSSEGDDISMAVRKERKRQLELLSRLFPSESLSTSLEHQEVVELDDNNLKGVTEPKMPVVKNFSIPTLVPQNEDSEKINQHEHLLRGSDNPSTFGKQSKDPFLARMNLDSEEKVNVSLDNDSTSLVLAKERAEQLELMHRLFGLDSPSSRNSEQVMLPEGNQITKENKSKVVQVSAEKHKAKCKTGKSRVTNGIEQADVKGAQISTPQQSEDYSLSKMDPEMINDVSDDILAPKFVEEQERRSVMSPPAVMSRDSLEDLEMTLNLGDDPVSIAVAEEQERQVLSSMSPTETVFTSVFQLKASGVDDTNCEVGKNIEEDNTEDNKDSLEAQEYSQCGSVPISESRLAKASLQISEMKISPRQQVNEPWQSSTLDDLCQFREVEMDVQSRGIGPKRDRNPQLAESSEDKPSTPTPTHANEVGQGEKPLQQQAEVENSTGRQQQLCEPSTSGQNLTRARWKSLVGETGRVVFSLHQLTSSSLPHLLSQTQETRVIEDGCIKDECEPREPLVDSSAPGYDQTKFKLPINTTRASTQSNATAPKVNWPVVPSGVSSGDCCPFMKSESAEKEWLATKSDLRLDYRAKHKHAARNTKKLRGKWT